MTVVVWCGTITTVHVLTTPQSDGVYVPGEE